MSNIFFGPLTVEVMLEMATDNGWPSEGTIDIAVCRRLIDLVDLDIDSDNSGIIDGSDSEDRIEDDRSRPGKVIQFHSGDTDGDGVPDFLDGFGLGSPPTCWCPD